MSSDQKKTPGPKDAAKGESRIGSDIHVDLAGTMTYGDYLQLDTLLAAKRPLTDKHDEHLFITIHHVQELWLSLFAHELDAAIAFIRADTLPPAFKALARITRILEQMIGRLGQVGRPRARRRCPGGRGGSGTRSGERREQDVVGGDRGGRRPWASSCRSGRRTASSRELLPRALAQATHRLAQGFKGKERDMV